MTTPTPSLEDRVTILETRLDTILPTLATKEDIARLDGKIDAMEERFNGKIDRLDGKMDAMEERFNGKIDRLDGKIDAMGNRLLIRLSAVAIAITSIAIAAVKYL